MLIECFAVAVIEIAVIPGIARYVVKSVARALDAYYNFKVNLGKTLLLGLQLSVTAHIVRTIAFEPTLEIEYVLGMLMLAPTFLRVSNIVEIDG